MDGCEVVSVEGQAEGNVVDFNAAYRVKNKALRRAQAVKDKRRKNKVCNQKACMRRHAYWHLIQTFSCVFKNVRLVITAATITDLYFVGSMKKMPDFRPPLRCKCDLCSSSMLHDVHR